MRLFFFASALLWLCKSWSKQMLIKNSHLLWRTRLIKYFKTIPNFGVCAVVKQAAQNLNLLLYGWLHQPDRYKLMVFKAKCCFCHKQWRSHCPVRGSFFQPVLHSLWVNWCVFFVFGASKANLWWVFYWFRGTKDKLDPLDLQGHQDPEVPQETLAKMVLVGCLA